MSWMLPKRTTEATDQTLIATGAIGALGVDPIDGDRGFVPVGGGPREVPGWSLERARMFSVSAYRANPMARAIIDTYVSFCVGDKGVSVQCDDPAVSQVVDRFWTDPRNALEQRQEVAFRSHLLQGETAWEMMVGESTGVVRFSPIDPARVESIGLDRGNALWPSVANIRMKGGEPMPLAIVQVDELTGLRTGELQWWISNTALETDTRGFPFLGPVLDWLDSYDSVLSNLIDRTALARYMVWDVTIDGGPDDVNKFISERGGTQAPASGTVEVHNQSVKWEPKFAQVGALEDAVTAGTLLTSVAAGSGLAKTWLAEPEHTNRATSLTMAEPVRRRVDGVQKLWLARQTELVRFAVDQAVAAGALPRTVEQHDMAADAGAPPRQVAPSDTVRVLGPEVAAADAQITAEVLVNLAQALETMVGSQIMTPEAATVAAKKAWEDFVGIPYYPELDKADGSRAADVAEQVDQTDGAGRRLAAVGGSGTTTNEETA